MTQSVIPSGYGGKATAESSITLGRVHASPLARHTLLCSLVEEARADMARRIDDFSSISGASMSGQAAWKLTRDFVPLGFESYRHAVGRFDSLRKELRTAREKLYEGETGPLRDLGPEVEKLVEIFDREKHRPDRSGFRVYVADVCPSILRAAARVEAEAGLGRFDEKIRFQHTHILGGRNAGKSELLKLLVHHYVRHPESGAAVVLDPRRFKPRHKPMAGIRRQ